MAKQRHQGHPARGPQGRAVAVPPGKELSMATLGLYDAAAIVVQKAERAILDAARDGDRDAAAQAIDVHHYIRTAALGLLVAYSQLEGLPDPREAAPQS